MIDIEKIKLEIVKALMSLKIILQIIEPTLIDAKELFAKVCKSLDIKLEEVKL